MTPASTPENILGNHDPVNLPELARAAPGQKPVWSHQGTDLSLNLISCTSGQALDSHVNTEVDVLLVGVEGTGIVEIDGRDHAIGPGHLVIIPKGSQRSIHCGGDQFAYLTCHRRRAGLMPAP